MKFNQTKKDEILSTTMYLRVLNKTGDQLEVQPTSGGKPFIIKGKSLIEDTIISASQYSTEKKLPRTELAEVMLGAGDRAFTAKFEKQDGQSRVIVAKLLDTENHMGRSNVIDLESTDANNRRQIDHRTLEYVILSDTKYNVK